MTEKEWQRESTVKALLKVANERILELEKELRHSEQEKECFEKYITNLENQIETLQDNNCWRD